MEEIGCYEIARDISLGVQLLIIKGWSSRSNTVDDLIRNNGLRKARLAFYIAEDFFINGNIEGTSQEIEIMLDGLEESFREVGRKIAHNIFLKLNLKIFLK